MYARSIVTDLCMKVVECNDFEVNVFLSFLIHKNKIKDTTF